VVERFCEWGEGVRLARFCCAEVILFSSMLKPTGAVYTALDRISLAREKVAGGDE
jgi:hypothetical protein